MKNIDLGRAIPDVKVPSIQSYKINKSDEKIVSVKEAGFLDMNFPT